MQENVFLIYFSTSLIGKGNPHRKKSANHNKIPWVLSSQSEETCAKGKLQTQNGGSFERGRKLTGRVQRGSLLSITIFFVGLEGGGVLLYIFFVGLDYFVSIGIITGEKFFKKLRLPPAPDSALPVKECLPILSRDCLNSQTQIHIILFPILFCFTK